MNPRPGVAFHSREGSAYRILHVNSLYKNPAVEIAKPKRWRKRSGRISDTIVKSGFFVNHRVIDEEKFCPSPGVMLVVHPHSTIREWFQVLKLGGFLVCFAPHQYLYEKRKFLPSAFNPFHAHLFTPARLLRLFEEALEPNSYRLRHLQDNDPKSTPLDAMSLKL